MRVMAKRVTRIDGAHAAENYYVTTPVTEVEGLIRVNAHRMLDYSRARLDVAILLANDFREQSQTGVVGLLTGSVGLLATARELLEPLHPGRFKLAMGLGHAQGGNAAETELHQTLDEMRRTGVRRVVLVDEVKSGTQMTTDMQAAVRWVKSTRANEMEITALGVCGAPPKGKTSAPTVAQLVTKANLGRQIILPRTIYTTSLLEMDTEGLKFRGVKRRDEFIGEYDYQREHPSAGLFFYCPDGGASGGAGVRSLDTAFNGTVNRILGLSNPGEGLAPMNVTDDPDGEPILPTKTWPDTIESGSCETCRNLLRIARLTAVYRHHWTSVAAYYLSENRPPNRDLDYWLAAEKQIANQAKQEGAPPWLKKLN